MVRSTQTDKNLDFNGQEDGVSYKELSAYKGNQYKEGFKNADSINFGLSSEALKGAKFGKKAGPSTASESKNNVESGRREWKPEATENYRGNPDKIHLGNPITRGNPKG
jgi:hypothetical protein